ncbi:MAG TPA: T9SS type A sorting domain-containing protein [Brumimicrobium sp.]|nr:T9SS type A sorting domain-containing protein [Brumimicrobium sp.]
MFSLGLNAQHISFESAEGYTLGDINGQNNWSTYDDQNGGVSEQQIISDELASDGSYSLKLSKDFDFPGAPLPFIGAFYNYPDPISTENADFSMDIYLTEQESTSMVTRIGLYDTDNGDYRSFLEFHFGGDISVLAIAGEGFIFRQTTGKIWPVNTWFNIKIETIGEVSKFYLNNEFIYEPELGGSGTINQLRFEHDNHEGIMYIDNVITNGQPLSVENLESDLNFTHFYNKESESLVIESANEALEAISVYNLMGQEIINAKLSKNVETIDMKGLNNGIYKVRLTVGNSIKTMKVLKQ